MTLKEAQKLIKWAKKQGISELSVEGLSFKLTEPREKTRKNAKPAKITTDLGDPSDESAKMPSDSDMLMYSSPAFDLITQSRKTS